MYSIILSLSEWLITEDLVPVIARAQLLFDNSHYLLVLRCPYKVSNDSTLLAHPANSAYSLHIINCGFGKLKLYDVLHI